MSIELVAAESPALSVLDDALAPEFHLGVTREAEVQRTYYDTFDALLRQAGLTYALEDRPLDPDELPDAVRRAIGVRVLLPRARLRLRVRWVPVLDTLEKTVVRVVLESGEVLGEGPADRPAPLRHRITLTGLRGYEAELAAVRDRLVATLGLTEAELPLGEEAVLAAGGRPEGVSPKVSVALAPDDRADTAAVAVLGALRDVMVANLPGTLADTDPEFLHDYRVALRKARSVLRELRGVFPPQALAELRADLRWLQAVTGPSRDLDVHGLDFASLRELVPPEWRDPLDPVEAVLRRRRESAHRAMYRELRGERVRAVMRRWDALLAELVELSEEGRPDAARPILAVSSQRILRVYRRMVRMGEALGDESPAADFHELRKQGKELRYLLELFGEPLHDGEVVRPMVKALKSLQDVLGRHQDREVQALTLRALAEEVAGVPGGPAALMAMGVLVERLDADTRAARAEFSRAFARFASAEQRERVRRTFR